MFLFISESVDCDLLKLSLLSKYLKSIPSLSPTLSSSFKSLSICLVSFWHSLIYTFYSLKYFLHFICDKALFSSCLLSMTMTGSVSCLYFKMELFLKPDLIILSMTFSLLVFGTPCFKVSLLIMSWRANVLAFSRS